MTDTKIEKWAALLRGQVLAEWAGRVCGSVQPHTRPTDETSTRTCAKRNASETLQLSTFFWTYFWEIVVASEVEMIEYPVVLECITAWLFLCVVTILSLHLWLAFSCAATHIWRNKWLKTSNRKKTILFVTLFEQKHNFCVTKRNV